MQVALCSYRVVVWYAAVKKRQVKQNQGAEVIEGQVEKLNGQGSFVWRGSHNGLRGAHTHCGEI
jgi:hypothetical protein